MRFLIFNLFLFCVTTHSFAQLDTLNANDSTLINSSVLESSNIKIKVPYFSDCAHSHICCASACSCCTQLSYPNSYDTTDVTKFAETIRYTVIEERMWASTYEKSKIQFLFTPNNGKTLQKYYSARDLNNYYGNPSNDEDTYFESGFEIVFDDHYQYFRISPSGERLGFSYQTDEKLSENIHCVSIILKDRRLFGLTDDRGELNEFGIGFSSISDPNENGYILATQPNGIVRVFNPRGELLFDQEYIGLKDISGGFYKVREENEEFLVGSDGKKRGKSYDELGKYSDGMISVRKGKNYGFINAEGKLIIRPQYPWVFDFTENRAAVSKNNETLGFIDRTGKLVIPFQFAGVHAFTHGRACVAILDKNNSMKWGIINLNGKFILKPKFDEMYSINDGYAKVSIHERGKGKGIIDLNGKTIIECQYDINGYGRYTPWFVDGVLLAKTYGKDTQLFLKNQKGETVKELNNYISGRRVQIANKLSRLNYYFVDGKQGKGMIDTRGEVIIEAKYTQIFILDEKHAITFKGEKIYLIDYVNNDTKRIIGNHLKQMPSRGLFVTATTDEILHYYDFEGNLLEIY